MTGREYDPAEIRVVAGKVGGLSSGLSETAGGVTGLPGSAAFGQLPGSSGIASALKSFGSTVKNDLKAGAALMTSTESALNKTAKGMDDDEDTTARSFGKK